MQLTRRGFTALLPAVLAAPLLAALPVPAGHRLGFAVWRKGSRIGRHDVVFTQAGDTLTVESRAHFSISFGPIVVFSYLYHVVEHWRGGALEDFSARTNNDGTHDTCSARREGGRLMVDGSRSGRYLAPSGSLAGTHWNKAELAAPMINPQDGRLMHYDVVDKGMSAPPGGGAAAEHYALSGFAVLDLWYDAAGIWVGLTAVAKDGSLVEYRKDQG